MTQKKIIERVTNELSSRFEQTGLYYINKHEAWKKKEYGQSRIKSNQTGKWKKKDFNPKIIYKPVKK